MQTHIRHPAIAPVEQNLASVALSYVEQEEAALVALLTSLRKVRADLLDGNWNSAESAAQEAAKLSSAASAAQTRRAAFRQAVAPVAGIPAEQVSLQGLASLLPPEPARRLLAARERLLTLAGDVETINRNNMTFIRYHLDFLQRFFSQITGGSRDSGTYGRSGKRASASCGSLIQARG